MGTRKWHLARAERNKQASEAFQADFPEWAVTALFYSALHYVHSSLADEPGLPKDERHPRKHTALASEAGRGTNQLVRDRFPEINVAYRSLVEFGHKSRYDVLNLDDRTIPLLTLQWKQIKDYCEGLNQGRHTISTQAP
jgi:hypothetical protein